MNTPPAGDQRPDIPRMHDPDGVMAKTIAALEPHREVDETPRGRLAGIYRDTWLVYQGIYALLTDRDLRIGPDEYEQQIQDLVSTLVDLDKREKRTTDETWEARLP